mgnify:CR=1 FL=1
MLPCRVAFIPFICAGDPDLDTTSLALRKLDEVGADVIELGVPYSVRVRAGLASRTAGSRRPFQPRGAPGPRAGFESGERCHTTCSAGDRLLRHMGSGVRVRARRTVNGWTGGRATQLADPGVALRQGPYHTAAVSATSPLDESATTREALLTPLPGALSALIASLAQDPLADGPVIQGAATRALDKHTTLDKVIEMVRRTAPAMKAPLVMFTYYNPIMRKGLDNFARTIKEAGAAGAWEARPLGGCIRYRTYVLWDESSSARLYNSARGCS